MTKWSDPRDEWGTQGYKQFLTSRKKMLDRYDRSKEQAEAHEVKVYHGKVAEAEFRDWLAGFLPKRYGVTPGYIVSQGVKANVKLPHFDVIIYDQLESPVLWWEDNSDSTSGGQSRAIPVEYVRSVIEVKSSFDPSTSNDAVNHLKDLQPLLLKTDAPGERYRKFFRPDFFSAIVFFELRKEYEFHFAAMKNLLPAIELRRFFGGLVLRGEGLPTNASGQIRIVTSNVPLQSSQKGRKSSLLSGYYETDSILALENKHTYLFLLWTDFNFATFAFDIVALLNNSFEVGRLSSFHGLYPDSSVLPK